MIDSCLYPSIDSSMRGLPQTAETCRSMALMLIEMRQPWIRRFFGVTDYQRARKRVIGKLQWLREEIATTRQSRLDPSLIQASIRIAMLHACCQTCPRFNRRRLARGEFFVCQLKEQELRL